MFEFLEQNTDRILVLMALFAIGTVTFIKTKIDAKKTLEKLS